MADSVRNNWYQWLMNRRHGGDPSQLQTVLEKLAPIRDRVLSNAALAANGTLLDIGCGDGLIALGALERLPGSNVIFSDISQALLDHVQATVQKLNWLDRSKFVLASADDLSQIPSESVEAVTTRSVLMYVSEIEKAFREFKRVLKPGGHLSIFEPISRFTYPEPDILYQGFDVSPVIDLANKIKHFHRHIRVFEGSMPNFDERVLLSLAEAAGFNEVHLDYEAQIKPKKRDMDWDTLIKVAGHPGLPTLSEAMTITLTAEERTRFSNYLRPLFEANRGIDRFAWAYLWAVK